MGAFSWRRIDGPWAGLPNGPMLDEHWAGLLPNYVLTGFPSTAFAGLVDSGMAVGWLHLAAAFTKRSFLGKAWITVTTFDFTSAKAAKIRWRPIFSAPSRRADAAGGRRPASAPEMGPQQFCGCEADFSNGIGAKNCSNCSRPLWRN